MVCLHFFLLLCVSMLYMNKIGKSFNQHLTRQCVVNKDDYSILENMYIKDEFNYIVKNVNAQHFNI